MGFHKATSHINLEHLPFFFKDKLKLVKPLLKDIYDVIQKSASEALAIAQHIHLGSTNLLSLHTKENNDVFQIFVALYKEGVVCIV